MDLEAGFDRWVRWGEWYPLRAVLENQGPDFKGRLVAQVVGQENTATEYGVEVVLPQGGKKEIILSLPVRDMNRKLEVRLDTGGKTVLSEKITLRVANQQDLLVAVLARDNTTLDHLASLQSANPNFRRRSEVMHLETRDFPEEEAVLGTFGVIVINDMDTTQLSDQQLAGLENWVRQGGTLVIGAGPNWRHTLAALPAGLVPFEVSGTKVLNNLSELEKMTGKRLPVGSATVVTGKPSGRVAIAAGQVPLLVEKKNGQGKVLFFTLDLALDPIAAWAGNTSLWKQLLDFDNPATISRNIKGSPMFSDPGGGMINEALRNIAALDLPSPKLLAVFLIGYIILVGPVMYLVLKKFDRRDWAWLAIPATVVLVAGAAYTLGFVGKGRDILTQNIAILPLNNQTKTVQVDTFMGIFAPSKDNYLVEIPGRPLISPMFNYNGNYSYAYGPGPQGLAAPIVDARVITGANTTIEFNQVNMWTMRSLRYQQEISNPGSITGSLRAVNGRVIGTITNQTPYSLTNNLVLSRLGFQKIAQLDPGATVKVDFGSSPLMNQQPGKSVNGPFFWRIFNPKQALYSPKPGMAPQQQVRPSRDNLRRQQIMEGVFGYEGEWLHEQITFVGWTESPLAAVKVNGRSPKSNYTELVWTPLELDYSGPEPELLPGFRPGALVSSTQSKGMGQGPPGINVLMNGSAVYEMEIPFADARMVSAAVYFRSPPYNPGMWQGAKAQVYNWPNQRWEDIKLKTGGTPLDKLEEQISPTGQVRVKMINNSQNPVEFQSLSLSAKGRRG